MTTATPAMNPLSASLVLIRGARPVGPGGPGLAMDILVENGRIARLGPGLAAPPGARVVEAAGWLVLPGLFDMNVHLREPGREDKENMASGSAAALNGGITGLLAMPNTDPPVDTGGMVQSVRDLAAARSLVPIEPAGCITSGRAGAELAAIGDMAEMGARLITDDPHPVENPQVLRRAMEYARDFGLIVASHATTPALVRGGALNEGPTSYALGLPGMPAIAEEIAIARDIAIARLTGCPLHFQHVSTARGIDIIRRARDEGVVVTCEVTPHHLILTEAAAGDFDTRFKMDPPLRLDEDREALLEALLDGTADVITSDHAPHSDFEKESDFASAPFGVSMLDTALPALFHHLVKPGLLPWGRLVEAYALAPRRLLGLPQADVSEGSAADFVLFDPGGSTVVDRTFLRSRGANNPFLGKRLDGAVRLVVLGKLCYPAGTGGL
jgi:dihydroorotase